MRQFCLLLLALLVTGHMSGQTIKGDWHGTLEFSGMKLRLVFHIQEEGEAYTATMDSPDQGANGIPVEKVTLEDGELTISLSNLGISYQGTLKDDGNTITGTFRQGGANIPLELGREAQEKPTLNRPQEPEPPYPYREEEVSYVNPKAPGVTLAGTLTIPEGEGPFPAVILISGSGPQNRNEELLGHKPFLVIADHFTRAGIAVLRYDDRGVAGSTGDFDQATSADFATDAQAGIDFLKSRNEIAANKIGLAGHSEGGLIAPMVAAGNPDVAFIILMAGPGVNGEEILYLQQELIAKAEGQSDEAIAKTRRNSRAMFKVLRKSKDPQKAEEVLLNFVRTELEQLSEEEKSAMGDLETVAKAQVKRLASPWFRFFLAYDPAESLQKVDCPVLAINGDKDLQVDAQQNLPMIAKALKRGGNQDVRTVAMPGLNHLFQHSETGRPGEYAELEETFAPEALQLMTEWIKSKL